MQEIWKVYENGEYSKIVVKDRHQEISNDVCQLRPALFDDALDFFLVALIGL